MSDVSSNLFKSAEPAASARPELQQGIPKATWGPYAAVMVVLTTYVLANAGASILLAGIPQLFGWSRDRVGDWLDASSFSQFLYILLAEALTLGMIWIFMRRRKGTLAMIGLGRGVRRNDVWQAVLGFFVYFGLFIVISLIAQALLPINPDQKQELGFEQYGQPFGTLVLIFVSLVILPPVTEEILFRGFLFSGLRRGMGIALTIAVTSIIFGAAHLLTGMSGEGLIWIAALDTFVLSLILCYMRLKTGSIWASIFIHMLKNSLAFVLLFILHAD
jgi:membrane protease YdiL (CAAX protease family)